MYEHNRKGLKKLVLKLAQETLSRYSSSDNFEKVFGTGPNLYDSLS